MFTTDSLTWYLIRTKRKQDFRAEMNLRCRGLETLAPRVREKRRVHVSERLTYVDEITPLFPGYIFARFDAAECLLKVRLTRGVHSVVGFGECATAVDESVIDMVRQRLDDEGCVKMETPKPGDKVRIVSGPLNSFEGIFERRSAQERVVILLANVLARVRVEVSPSDIVSIITPS
jgi:transcriptional antiterminator RfaH